MTAAVDQTVGAVSWPCRPPTTGADVSVGPSVADILDERVTLEVERIDRMYLKRLRALFAVRARRGGLLP